MPIKTRHDIRHVGAVVWGSYSPDIDVSEADSIIWHIDPDAALTIKTDGSSDGGTTWYRLDSVYFGQVQRRSTPIDFPVPGLVRFFVTSTGAGNVTDSWIEIVRDF